MTDVYICHPRRTAVGRFGGALSNVRPDDLAASIFKAVMAEAPRLDPTAIDDVFMGCANQAGRIIVMWRACLHSWPACRSRCPAPQ